jgi:hypothetical protein
MSIFDRLFKPSEHESNQTEIAFGRYSDSYKSAEQFAAWDQALSAFEAGEYIKAYRAFFTYLYDEKEDNLHTEEEKDAIYFELYQGSKKVTGKADRLGVKAEARIISAPELKASFTRRMLELNFDLKYSRYALSPNNDITIVFNTAASDGSPYKLYFALKELATSADKQDDLLLDEFKNLQPLETNHLQPIPENQKKVKYDYLVEEITAALKIMDDGKLDLQTYPGGYSYLLLDLCYRLDYLIKPEGFMMETLERMNREFFTNTTQNTLQKVYLLRKEFESLQQREKTSYFKEMYRVKNSFGITGPVDQQKVQAIIDGELHNMDWYQENGHTEIAVAIPSYIVGYCLFTYAVPRPIRELFHLFYQISQPHYFRRLGIRIPFVDQHGQFHKRAIRKQIREISERHTAQYPHLIPQTSLLNFNNLLDFARSYLLLIRELDLTPA